MNRIVVLTLATKENIATKNCIDTLSYYKYEYYIIGRGEIYNGRNWRTEYFIEGINFLKGDTNDIFVLVDSNDLFFVAPPEVLLQKFLNFGSPLVIGAGNAQTHFDKCVPTRAQKEYFYEEIQKGKIPILPNASCVMGYRNELLDLLENNKFEALDQEGYLNMIINGENQFTLDKNQDIVINYERKRHAETSVQSSFQNIDGKLLNCKTGISPVIVHFPNKNWLAYNFIAKIMFPTSPFREDAPVRLGIVQDVGNRNIKLRRKYYWVEIILLTIIAISIGHIAIDYFRDSVEKKQNKKIK